MCSGDKSRELDEGGSGPFECYEGIDCYFKFKLRDRKLPITFVVSYLEGTGRDLNVFLSSEIKEPNEKANHGMVINVSAFASLTCAATQIPVPVVARVPHKQ